METTEGTFFVTEADAESAILTDVADGQVHTLAEQAEPPLEQGEVLVGTLVAEPPMTVAWSIDELDSRRTIPVDRSPESPTKQERDIASEQPVGELTREPRAGEGEIHILTVPEAQTDQAVADVLDDPQTVARAARLGVDRVEIRAEDGVLSVRYLPN